MLHSRSTDLSLIAEGLASADASPELVTVVGGSAADAGIGSLYNAGLATWGPRLGTPPADTAPEPGTPSVDDGSADPAPTDTDDLRFDFETVLRFEPWEMAFKSPATKSEDTVQAFLANSVYFGDAGRNLAWSTKRYHTAITLRRQSQTLAYVDRNSSGHMRTRNFSTSRGSLTMHAHAATFAAELGGCDRN